VKREVAKRAGPTGSCREDADTDVVPASGEHRLDPAVPVRERKEPTRGAIRHARNRRFYNSEPMPNGGAFEEQWSRILEICQRFSKHFRSTMIIETPRVLSNQDHDTNDGAE
jgi:hypothetical protein